jgi:phosphoribosylformimino-5-aminoimidazole carboxamide ribotide isomerase|tara:strand:+ start:4390 stop:5103 length:714 start_codon:yes stop_codon:yes gene_type:complete
MKIVPSIDLLDGRVVRLKQGKPELATFYDYSPLELVEKWQKIGISRMHIVDLDATLERGNNYELIKKISENTKLEIQIGGGIRDIEYAKKISKDVSKIVIGTIAMKNKELFQNICEEVGLSKIILSLDYIHDQIMINGWRDETGRNLYDSILEFVNSGIETILLTAIKKDGMLEGPDVETLQKVRKNTNIEIQASGGFSSIEDIKKVRNIGVEYIILGRAIHSKIISIEDAIAVEDL